MIIILGKSTMDRLYKDVQEFLKENFPNSYRDLRERKDIRSYMEESAKEFGKRIDAIIQGD